MQYKVLFIDWDGTLCKSRFWERWKNTPEDNAKYNLIQSTLFMSDEGRLMLKDWMLGLRAYDNVLRYVADVTGIAYDDLAKELRYSAEHMDFIDEEAIRSIQQLRGMGVKVLVATDNMDSFRNWTMPALKIETLFDGVITSDTRGALKTHLRSDGTSLFFNHFFSQTGIKPEETVLIDDSLDTKIIEQAGIDFMLVNERDSLTSHLRKILGVYDRKC